MAIKLLTKVVHTTVKWASGSDPRGGGTVGTLRTLSGIVVHPHGTSFATIPVLNESVFTL